MRDSTFAKNFNPLFDIDSAKFYCDNCTFTNEGVFLPTPSSLHPFYRVRFESDYNDTLWTHVPEFYVLRNVSVTDPIFNVTSWFIRYVPSNFSFQFKTQKPG